MSESQRQEGKALKIIAQVSELIKGIESRGIEVSNARTSLDLAKSFIKAQNPTKAIQYATKADVLARAARDRAELGPTPDGGAAQAQAKTCPSCGAALEAGWKACPGCGQRGL
jgi:hypothetical protein